MSKASNATKATASKTRTAKAKTTRAKSSKVRASKVGKKASKKVGKAGNVRKLSEASRKCQAKPAPMPDFLATLSDEHRYFESLIDIIREQQALLESGADADYRLLEESLQYLAEYPEDYHHPREDLLFERLREIDPWSGDMLDSLLAGHESIHHESNHLHYIATKAAAGQKVRRKRLAAALQRYIDGYEKHIHDEDQVIFARALVVLTEEDWAAVEDGMEYVEDPLFGTRVRRRYRNLANVLEARVGVARRDLVAAEYLTISGLIDGLMTVADALSGVGGIVRDRTSQGLRQNLTEARDSLASGDIGDILGLPGRLRANSLNNLKGGFSDTRELLGRALEDIRTPYNMRVDTLKDILREDFSN